MPADDPAARGGGVQIGLQIGLAAPGGALHAARRKMRSEKTSTRKAHARVAVALLLAAAGPAAAQTAPDPALFADPAEAALWQWFRGRQGVEQEFVKRDPAGKVEYVAFWHPQNSEQPTRNYYRGSFSFDADRRVAKIVCDGAGLANDELARLAGCRRLKVLTFFHNNFPAGDTRSKDELSGAGLAAFAGSGVEEVLFGGCPFGDAGMAAVKDLPRLRVLSVYHNLVTDAGVKLLAGHPALEEIYLGPMFTPKITDASLAVIGALPKIKRVRVVETYLTWEQGLRHLVAAGGALESVDLGDSLVAPEDVIKLREALPKIEIKHDGPAVRRERLGDPAQARKKLAGWVPAAVLDVYCGPAAAAAGE